MKKILIILFGVSVVLSSCKKDEKLVNYKVEGYAQKGPFLAGANVTIIELDTKLNPTGRTFNSTIEDNTGKFSFPNVKFASPFVQIKVKGKEYNEVDGFVSNDELTLYSIADISTTSKVNVNIVTNMVEARLKILVDAGSQFVDAKLQAENEVLKLFNLDSLNLANSETFDLNENSTKGGVLLLISSIIQSNICTNMTFQEYVTNLQTDFKTDGVLNSDILIRSIASSAFDLNVDQIILNLKNRYNEAGLTFTPYDIKPLLNKFNNNTKYPSIYKDIFPTTINNAVNLISNQDTIFINKNLQYVMAINSPINNAFDSIVVAITSNSSEFSFSNANLYTVGNSQRFSKIMTNNTNLSIPISFNNSGQLTLQTLSNIKGEGSIKIKTRIVIWK